MRSQPRLLVPTESSFATRGILAALLIVSLLLGCTPRTDSENVDGDEGDRVVAVIGEQGVDVDIDDISVSVPAGAAPAGTELIIERAIPRDAPTGELDDDLFELATTMYDFSLSSGGQPAAPIIITFPIPPDGDPEHLAFVTMNSETGLWEGIPVEVEEGVATVHLAHFSWGGFLFAKEVWTAIMRFAEGYLLGISDPPECYGETLTLDGVQYSVSSSSVLYHACVEEVDGAGALQIYNSGPYTWTLQAQEGLGEFRAPLQTPGIGLEPGDRVVTVLTRTIFSASDGSMVQLSPSSYVPVSIDATEGSFRVAMEMDAGLSTLYMTLDAAVELAVGEVIGEIEGRLDDLEGDYAALQCLYGGARATQDARELAELLNCVGPVLDGIHLDDAAKKRLSIVLAILASFGPKVTQMLTGAYASLAGDAQGIVEVSITPLTTGPAAPTHGDGLPEISDIPGCDDPAHCYYSGSLRIDHPTNGELQLALVTRLDDAVTATSPDGLDAEASGALFVIDESGRITDLYGESADDIWIAGTGASTSTELERLTWKAYVQGGASSPDKAFHFHDPGIDAGGNILIASPGRIGHAAVSLRVDPRGYFAEPDVVSMYTSDRIDWTSIPTSAAPPTDYFGTYWAEVDSSGLATLELVSGGDEFGAYETKTPLRRDGDTWVFAG